MAADKQGQQYSATQALSRRTAEFTLCCGICSLPLGCPHRFSTYVPYSKKLVV